MTRLPSDHAARDLCDSLRALNQRPHDKALAEFDARLIDSIERRLLIALQRDRTGSVIPDGYPTSTGGGRSGGSRTIVVPDENGQPDRVPVTAIEAAVVALVDGDTPRDRHHDLTVRAVEAIDSAVVALNTCVAALASIDDLVSEKGPAPKTCAHCTSKRGEGSDRPIYATGTVGDRLERSVSLCKHCYGFVEQTARPGTHTGYLPSDDQIRDHEQRGRWRMRVA